MTAFEPCAPATAAGRAYEIAIAGTGFGSSFFLHKLRAKRQGRPLRVLVLEWGGLTPHTWRRENKSYTRVPETDTYTTSTPWKYWWFTTGFGGGTNCWGAYPPRQHPNDFRLFTLYGVGRDWPFGYDELEPYYAEAEEIMHIAGDGAIGAVIPRSRPFPARHHRLSTPDMAMKKAMPEWHFGAPSARVTAPRGARAPCCASMACELCPVDSKFTIENSLPGLYSGEGIDVVLGARVTRLETTGGKVSSVVFEAEGRTFTAKADFYVLGANALQSPFILLKSGMGDRFTGLGLHEKLGCSVEVFLKGMKNFDGGTRNTGCNYALYDGPWRRESGAVLVNFQNFWLHGVRIERGRWQEVLPLAVSIEDLPDDSNRVTAEGDRPHVHFEKFSDYAHKGVARMMAELPKLLAPLPVEDIKFRALRVTNGHLQGTLRMGHGPQQSVVDARQIHHRYRNLMVVGSAVFPSCSAANPSLTVAATSLRAADLLV